jgi:hypothetical protein
LWNGEVDVVQHGELVLAAAVFFSQMTGNEHG